MILKTVIHIPHSSTNIPYGVRDQFLLTKPELKQELILMTDWYVNEIFGGMDGASDVIFPVSRDVGYQHNYAA
jgi:hypothetical protein